MVFSWRGGPVARCLLLSLLFLAVWEAGSGQVHYLVPEEAKHGTFVGRIAEDLGLELAELVPRQFRVASKGRGDLLEVSLQNGILFVNSRIDREELCGRSLECSIHLEVIVERPLQVFHVEVEVKDINDNPPKFLVKEQELVVSESRMPDSWFPLEGASDADTGANSVLTYRLSYSDYFTLDVNSKNEENKQVGLVLRKSLDREKIPEHNLLLTATDGGKPELTGTVQLLVIVLDVNDNAPSFDQSEYEVRIFENSDNGTIVIRLNASDPDEGANREISYSFNSPVPPMIIAQFAVHAESGKVYALQPLDHEELELLQFQVSARDAGVPPLSSNMTLQVFVLDENDNAPALLPPGAGGGGDAVSQPVARSVGAGHVVAKVRAVDADSGYNAWLSYELQPESGGLRSPFRVGLYTGEISTTRALDEADAQRQCLLVLVKDQGEPALASTATVLLSLVDSGQAPKASLWEAARATGPELALVDVNVYLIIAICAVSSLLVLTLLLYTALRCSAPPTQRACGREKPTLVCSSAVGSWSCSQHRKQRECSGEGRSKSDLMAFSPCLPPCPGSVDVKEDPHVSSDSSGKVGCSY
ncbi:protocadherin alpha-8-like, partial [Pteropus alecto]|uniref:protocadherin alpha-8-like n=1 Tax=Pteropus alecto TaxID=9402 RepID=UPI00076855B1